MRILELFQIHLPVNSLIIVVFFLIFIIHSSQVDILYSYHYVSNQNKIVNTYWIPSHNGKLGNNEADKAAKSALDYEIVKFKIPFTDLKFFL